MCMAMPNGRRAASSAMTHLGSSAVRTPAAPRAAAPPKNVRREMMCSATVLPSTGVRSDSTTRAPLRATAERPEKEEAPAMEYRTLGSTGVRVSTHCLGTMMFGPWGNDDAEDCARIVRRAIDGGINFVDTADMYSAGRSEEIVGLALKGSIRDDVVLATKFHNPMGLGQNQRGNSRLWIMRAVEDSLRRLGTDHIDLYQVHRPEGETAIEETLSALTDLQRRGEDPILRLVDVPGMAAGRGAVGGRTARVVGVPHGAAAVLDLRAPHRARRAPGRAGARDGRAGVEPARSRLAHRAVPPGQLRRLTGRAGHPREGPRAVLRGAVRRLTARDPAEARPGRSALQGRRGRGRLRWRTWRSPSRSPIRRSRRRSSAPARSNSWKTSSPARTCVWTRRPWTRSTSSYHPERSSTRTIAASPRGGSSPPSRRRG